ncbi:hypothetical protein SK128_003316 [Halocaridina rubra]|uniref:C2H2-type domain-containing protein n=1 Tax=Halocaridina rubra TaxID=373956 RepID=A0AAN8X5J0_HALRR
MAEVDATAVSDEKVGDEVAGDDKTTEHAENADVANEDAKEKATASLGEEKKSDYKNLSRTEKSRLNNMTYEEQIELRKDRSIGNILSGLTSGAFGQKAKENIVKIEETPRADRQKRGWSDGPGQNKKFCVDQNSADWRNGTGGWASGPRGWGSADGSWGGWGSVGAGWEGGNGGWGSGSGAWGCGMGECGDGEEGLGSGNGEWGGGNEYDCGWSGEYTEEEEKAGPSANHSNNDEWIAEETKILEEEYGEGVVSILDDQTHGLVYYCEICPAQVNARKSLEKHMNGARHLKKKNLWEKKKRIKLYTDVTALVDVEKEKEKKKDEEPPIQSSSRISEEKDEQVGGSIGDHLQGFEIPSFPGDESSLGQWVHSSPSVSVPDKKLKVPPPPTITDKPKEKSNLCGGATGLLLKKLAACAVKSLKDSDLATNVVVALVKTMKEYNHVTGDTKAVAVLTEIGVKLRNFKEIMPKASTDLKPKTVYKRVAPYIGQTPASSYSTVGGSYSTTVNTHYLQGTGIDMSVPPPQQPPLGSTLGGTDYASGGSYVSTNSLYQKGSGMTEANMSVPPPQQPPTTSSTVRTEYTGEGSYKSLTNTPYYQGRDDVIKADLSVPPPQPPLSASASSGTGYTASSSGYGLPQVATQPSQATYQMPAQVQSGGYGYGATSSDSSYYSQGSDSNSYSTYTSQVNPQTAVINIIQSTAVPPPPPPPPEDNSTNYTGQNYVSHGYQGYYSQPPPGY